MCQINNTAGQPRSAKSVISRFTIILLGAMLIGMSVGRGLEAELAEMCSFIGLLSMACYLSLELASLAHCRQRAFALQRLAEDRLACQKQWQRLERFCRISRPARAARMVPVMTDLGLTA